VKWEDSIRRDSSLFLTIRGWTRQTGDRTVWRRTNERSGPETGCCATDEEEEEEEEEVKEEDIAISSCVRNSKVFISTNNHLKLVDLIDFKTH